MADRDAIMANVSNIMGDIGVRMAVGTTAVLAVGSAIVLPSDQQKEAAAHEMYSRPYRVLAPNEQKAVQFRAGYKRWTGFVENNIYSWTRKLPGHDNPVVNPYKGVRKPQPRQPQPTEAPAEEEAGAQKQ